MAEPLVAFYHVVMRPPWGPLESGRAREVWADARARFAAQVVGPHFEQLCRDYALMAPAEAFGALPGEVGAGMIADPSRKTSIEIDVAVLGPAIPGEPRRVLSLGEAKYGEIMSARQLQRLRRARDLLAERGYDTRDCVLALYSGAGFEPGLAGQAADGKLALIGLPELYERAPAD